MGNTKLINDYMRFANKKELQKIIEQANFDDLQLTIFTLRYVKNHNISYIADCCSLADSTIKKKLAVIRKKIEKSLKNID